MSKCALHANSPNASCYLNFSLRNSSYESCHHVVFITKTYFKFSSYKNFIVYDLSYIIKIPIEISYYAIMIKIPVNI